MQVMQFYDLQLGMCIEPQHIQAHIALISLFKIHREVSRTITLIGKESLETVLSFPAEEYIRLASTCYVRT